MLKVASVRTVREGCVLVRCSYTKTLDPICSACEAAPYITYKRWTFPADPAFTQHKCCKCGQPADSEPLASGIVRVSYEGMKGSLLTAMLDLATKDELS